MAHLEPVHVTVPGSPDDPRSPRPEIDGVVIHYAPPLHPADLDEVDGIPVTSVSRTLVDLAEDMSCEKLRATFARAERKGLLDTGAVRASTARADWRPSLPMLYGVLAEFER